MQERMYKKPICDLAELKQRLVKIWADLEQTIVDEAIDQWRKRLKACVKAKKNNILNIYYNFSRTCRLLVSTFFRC